MNSSVLKLLQNAKTELKSTLEGRNLHFRKHTRKTGAHGKFSQNSEEKLKILKQENHQKYGEQKIVL